MNSRETSPFFRSYLIITLGVCIAHALLVWGMTFSSNSLPKPKVPPQLVVRSVQLTPRAPPKNEEVIQAVAMVTEENKKAIEEIKTEMAIPVPTPKPIEEPIVLSKVEEQTKPPEKPRAEAQKKAEPVLKAETKPNPPKSEPKPAPKPKPVQNKPPEKAKPAPPKPKPKKEVKPEPKKEVKSTPTQPKEKPIPTPPKPSAEEVAALEAAKARQKEQLARQKELLAEAEKSLAKAGEVRGMSSVAMVSSPKNSSLEQTALPKAIGSLQIEALPQLASGGEVLTAKEISYRDEVASRLRMALKLPDYGEVKIKLTLARSGKVDSVQVISSESAKNRQYVEKTLPSMTFLPFGNRFGEASQFSFSIVLKNKAESYQQFSLNEKQPSG